MRHWWDSGTSVSPGLRSRGQTEIVHTAAVDPGSERGERLLRGTIVTISGGTVANVQMTSG